MDEELQGLITQHRQTAEEAGTAAIQAMQAGDIGLARSLARQAAQWARIVVQLETGEKQSSPLDTLETEGDNPALKVVV